MIEVVFSWASKTTLADFQSGALPTELSSHPPKKGGASYAAASRTFGLNLPLGQARLVTRGALSAAPMLTFLECAFSHPTVPFCAMPTTTPGGTTPPDGGAVTKHTPHTTRAVFWDGNPGGVTSPAPRPRRRKCATPGRPSVATPVFGFAGYRGGLASGQIDENTKQVHGDGLLCGTVPRVG